MSLQVWLPFTDGTLKQQGLSNAAATSGGTVNLTNVGKLGKCATLGTAAGGITLPASTMTSFTKCSVAFWIKIISWNTSYATLFQAGLGSTPWNNYIFGILRNNANSNLCFTLTNSSSSSTSASYVSSNLEVGQWYHLAFVYNTGVCKIYINGVEDKSYNTSYVPNFAGITHISIGRSTTGSNYQTNCSLNDFRIYDHALSPMEIKWLSQGLVLHYPLNRMGFGQENLLIDTQKELGQSRTTYNIADYNFSESLVNGDIYTITAKINTSSEKTFVGFYHSGGSYSMSGWLPITTNGYYQKTFTANSNMASQTSGAGHGYCRVYVSNNPAGTQGSYTLAGTSNVEWIKIEKGSIATPWCPNSSDALATTMGLNSAIEYDTSGFSNNGIKNNLPTYSSDTAKYTVSTHVDGVNQTIQLPNLLTLIPDSIFTFNIWFKRLSTEPSSKPWETLLGGPSGFEIETCSANNVHDNKIKAYSWGGGTIEFELDKWNMLTMVSNGTNALFYLNGELKLTGTYKALVSGNYFIGSWRDTATQNYKGYVSDVRIYATALSAEDVKSLYQNCATIDPDGTIRGQIRS